MAILWYWLSCEIGYPVILTILWYWVSCEIGYSVILVILWYWVFCDIGYPVILGILWYWVSCDIGYPVILAILWYWVSCDIGYPVIVPQYMNITTKFSTLKLLFFSFSSCLTIERSIVFKTMDRQCDSFFSRIFSSATRLDKSFIFIRDTLTSSSNNENSEI